MNKETSPFPKELLGRLLLRQGILTSGQIQAALAEQQKRGGLLGEILVRLGFLQEIDVVAALVNQCAVPYVAIEKYPPNPQVLAVIPEKLAQSWRLIPLDRVGDVLSVVMADPFDGEVRQRLETLTGLKIATFIATPTAIQEAIARWYPGSGMGLL